MCPILAWTICLLRQISFHQHFDNLFEKFCNRAGSHRFPYFDECWATCHEKDVKSRAGYLEDCEADTKGTLVVNEEAQVRQQKPHRPLFDVSSLDKPVKPIETELVRKHQLNEKAGAVVVTGERDADLRDDACDEDFDGEGDRMVRGCDQDDLHVDGSADCFGLGTSLETDLTCGLADQPTKVGSTDITYTRNSKYVDIKLLKKHLWDSISEEITDAKFEGKRVKSFSFQDLVQRTVRRMPMTEVENVSVQVCFICTLHLCNEKGLELVTDPGGPLGNFAVTARV